MNNNYFNPNNNPQTPPINPDITNNNYSAPNYNYNAPNNYHDAPNNGYGTPNMNTTPNNVGTMNGYDGYGQGNQPIYNQAVQNGQYMYQPNTQGSYNFAPQLKPNNKLKLGLIVGGSVALLTIAIIAFIMISSLFATYKLMILTKLEQQAKMY